MNRWMSHCSYILLFTLLSLDMYPYRGHQFQQQLMLISSSKQPQSRDVHWDQLTTLSSNELSPDYASISSRCCYKTMQLACLLGRTLQQTRISTHLAFTIDKLLDLLPTLHNCCNLSTNPISTLHCTKKVDTQLKALW